MWNENTRVVRKDTELVSLDLSALRGARLDPFYNADPMVGINDLVTDLEIHAFHLILIRP
jgi:hypothetical protein